MNVQAKLEILADAAKYDASCASSGSTPRNSAGSRTALGSTGGAGICHSYAPDGRCISLLKVLLTNTCIYDCHYCINRRSSDIRRARFTPEEVVNLTLDFYKRNYIEGLFLSSGIIRNADHTMAMVIEVARQLRVDHDFRGYLHLKTIPDASQELIDTAGRFADRISINVELPTQASLDRLAPEKNLNRTQKAMGGIRTRIEEDSERRKRDHARNRQRSGNERHFAPAGQSTQLIVGADDAPDKQLLERADILYGGYRLKRVYYSAFSPIPSASPVLPLKPPPLVREHRLYQADWLMRFYGYAVSDILPDSAPNLELEIDPKLAWALRNRGDFPVDVNKAPREILLRVPGIGVRSVNRLIGIRRWSSLRLEDLRKLGVSLKKVLPFVITMDHRPSHLDLDGDHLRRTFASPAKQTEFDFSRNVAKSAISGEI